MSMWLLQRQMAETSGPFRRALACGSARQMALLLRQAGPVLGGPEGAIRLLEVPGPPADARALDRLVGSLRSRGCRVNRDSIGALGIDAIIDTVERERHELVLKAVSRASDDRRMMPDALDRALIDRCPCPVWLGDVVLDRPPQRVAAAVEPAPDDRVTHDIARAVLTVAGTVARAAEVELQVLSAWVPFGAHFLRSRAAPEDVDAYVRHAEQAVRRTVDDLLVSSPPVAPLPNAFRHLVCGAMALELPRLIREHAIELIVIGTRGRRSRISSRLMAPHARQLLERATCSVLVVKP